MSALVEAQPVLVNASRFRAAHEAEWEQLDALVTLIEKRSLRRLSDDELLALPLLYRATLSSLSVARETSLDNALIVYLEQLCTRAYFQLYGVPTSAWRQLGQFFARGWPRAVQSLWRETLVSLLLTLAGTIVGYLLVKNEPSWFYGIIPGGLAGGRDPSASAETLKAVLYADQKDSLAVFATFLFTHNAQIAVFSFALGFAFAVPTVLLILYNGLMLGAFIALYAAKGLGYALGGWLIIHGTTEIFAIVLAGAAGFRIGTAIAFPGRRSRADSAIDAGRTGALVMGGTVVMLMVAGLLEGVGRQTINDDLTRYGIGVAMLVGWVLYFYLPRRSESVDG
ncbi:stage II sporulation protein M [Sphingomonas sp. ERG5]|uniref:stage II sporulation protein M n=1 Tax=Sphingomonas sp. ERG5 TaxID=1381597 RepID=UPI00054B1129|nr:stage II sporulation protein M [Sphingomonas sp. ERG5]